MVRARRERARDEKHTGKTVWKTDRSAKWNDENIEQQMVKEGGWRAARR